MKRPEGCAADLAAACTEMVESSADLYEPLARLGSVSARRVECSTSPQRRREGREARARRGHERHEHGAAEDVCRLFLELRESRARRPGRARPARARHSVLPVPVLVLDAEGGLGDRLRQALRGEGCSVRQVWNLAEASKLQPVAPSVILLNREFPGGDVRELVREWRRNPDCRDAAIVAFWRWPPAADPVEQVVVFRIAGESRREVSEAELTAHVRALVQRARLALGTGAPRLPPASRRR